MCLCVQGASIDVECPTFHMKCLPYQTAEERSERALRTKKTNWSLKLYAHHIVLNEGCFTLSWSPSLAICRHISAESGMMYLCIGQITTTWCT